MAFLENAATAAMLFTAAALAVISALAWWRTGSRRILFLAIGFALFLLKAVMLSIGLFWSVDWGSRFLPYSVLLDLTILLAFYGAILQPRGG